MNNTVKYFIGLGLICVGLSVSVLSSYDIGHLDGEKEMSKAVVELFGRDTILQKIEER